MIIFVRELKRNRKSLLIWMAALLLSSIGLMAMYPTMAADSEILNEMVKSYPEEMLKALNMDKLNLGEILDFFAYVFVYITLFGGIYAMLLGAGILSKEESDKTIEFLLAKPVTRNRVITAKALCVLVYLFIFNVVFILGDLIAFEVFKKEAYDFGTFLLVHLGMLLLQVMFAATGFLISVFVVKAKTVMPISLGVVLGTFFLGIASAISDKLEGLKYLSPPKYFDPALIVAEGRIEPLYMGIMAAVSALCIVLTYVFYNRKNISV